MRSKKGFTLVECLISLLIISVVGLSAIYITNGYLKNAHLRDDHMKEMIENIDTVERLKAEVTRKGQLQEFVNNNPNVTIFEINPKLYKIEVGDSRKLTVIMRVGDDGG